MANLHTMLLSFFILIFSTTTAQTKNSISGKVIDYKLRSPILNAIIIINDNNRVVYKTNSDTLGNFSIPLDKLEKVTNLTIESQNYFKLTLSDKDLALSEIHLMTKKKLGNFELKEKTILLKEVIIRKNKRYKDTTTIDLSREKNDRTIMISDILSNSKGFFQDNTGQLFFKGKKVSDISVDGGTFFGKNNLDIYKSLPALVLEKIQIIETDIDSLTNITMMRPSVSVNMILKDDYKKGLFGSANIGYGTLKRYISSTNLYKYKKNEQISFSFNINNIDINSSQPSEPTIMFSLIGNNALKTIPKIEYRNILFKKLEVMTSIHAIIENKFLLSESERKDEILNQQTKVYNSSKTKSINIDQSYIKLIYRINNRNNLTINFNTEYTNTDQSDSLNYNIKFNALETISNLNKQRTNYRKNSFIETIYNNSFSAKKGGSLSVGIKMEKRTFQITDNNNVFSFDGQNPINFFLNGSNYLVENELNLNVNVTKPINESTGTHFGLSYRRLSTNNIEILKSDTLKNERNTNNNFINDFLNPNFRLQKTFDNFSIIADMGAIINFRKMNFTRYAIFTPNIEINNELKINRKNDLSIKYTAKPNFPNIDQLTNINNSFNLISQNSGNVNLKPEIIQRIGFNYQFKKSDSLVVSFLTGVSLISSKFGHSFTTNSDAPQQIQTSNIGMAISTDASMSITMILKNGREFIIRNSLAYQQMPSMINTKKISTDGLTFNNGISTKVSLIKDLIYIYPSITVSNSRFKYEIQKSNLTSIFYTDKISLNIQKLQLNLYPFINYSKGFGKNFTWAFNAEIKKSILKNNGSIWLKSYDIFNSFKFANNIIGATYIETLKYSTLQSYSLLGISIRFNNIK